MSELLIQALADGTMRAIASVVLFPLMYGMLLVLLWGARQFVDVPQVTYGQLAWIAIGITMLSR